MKKTSQVAEMLSKECARYKRDIVNIETKGDK